jgi:hypothetical protein
LRELAEKNDANYREALAVIRAGQEMLARRPRADMPNFQLVSQTEIDQEAKYRARLKAESAALRAIVRGERKHDAPRDGGR